MPKGNRGGSNNQRGNALPEKLVSHIGGYTIEGDTVTTPSGAKVRVSSFDEIKDQRILKSAKEHNIEDPVIAGRLIAPRQVVETAISQEKQQRENYKKNMENNVPGYDILASEIAKRNSEYAKQRASIERGEILYSAKETNVEALKKQYPRAAAYMKAEAYAESSNYRKSALGEKAKEDIRHGKSYKKAIDTMEEEWKKYVDRVTD